MKQVGRSSRRSAGHSGKPLTQLSIGIVLFFLCLITYHGISDNFFFNDDFLWLRDAHHAMNVSNLWSYRVIDFFRPLVNLSFYVSERFFPGDILFYHWFNIILHFLNCVMVYLLVAALLRSRMLAVVTAVLFAVTSVHDSAVFWVSARTTLLSTCFLLGSFLALAGRRRFGTGAAILLYALALTAKETAIVGFPLALLIYLTAYDRHGNRLVRGGTVASFAVISAAYFVVRLLVMGQLFQNNWHPGTHVLRNLAGGFLYQLYPWPVFSFVFRSADHFPDPQNLLWLEAVALPVLLLLLWLAMRTKMTVHMLLATGWSLIALLPSSFFTYRFFSAASMTQNRYYYLSSVGSVLIIAILLAMVWRSRSKARQTAAGLLVIILCAGYMMRVDLLEKRWDAFTQNYQRVISIVIDEVHNAPAVSAIAIEDAPMEFKYLEGALAYLHPEWRVHEAVGGLESAAQWAPCLYIYFELEPGMLNVTSTMVE